MRHGGWADGTPAGRRAIGNHGTTASPPPRVRYWWGASRVPLDGQAVRKLVRVPRRLNPTACV